MNRGERASFDGLEQIEEKINYGHRRSATVVENRSLKSPGENVDQSALQTQEGSEQHLLTDVVIIGNGPSGLALSAFLAGWHPFYNVSSAHPNRRIHERMMQNAEQSLIDQDLSWLSTEYLDTRSSNPLSALYDCLVRPDADLGHEHASSLRWGKIADRSIPHVVLGNGEAGGAWNDYDDHVIPLSLSNWMDLPGYGINDWLGGKVISARLPCLVIRKYFAAYPKHMGLCKNLFPHHTVTRVYKSILNDDESYWNVEGYNENGMFNFRCKKVVLATGLSEPKVLDIDGELSNDRVVHDMQPLKELMESEPSDPDSCSIEPVIVVGDGITAADAIIYCLFRNVPVLHVFRRTQKQIRGSFLGRLSKVLYPEYQSIVRLMTERDINSLYHCLPQSDLISIQSNIAMIKRSNEKGVLHMRYRFLAICIGRRSHLSFLPDSHRSALLPTHSLNYESISCPGLYCVGPLAGDNFVRYLVGGCLGVARHFFSLI